MPNRHTNAVQVVEGLLGRLFKGVRNLSGRELSIHGGQYTRGWEIPGISGIANHDLRLLITSRFPYWLPRVALFPEIPVLSWPHVEEHGLLCLRSERDGHSVDQNIEGEILDLLGEARDLIQVSSAKQNTQDFEDEFQNYWAHWSRTKAKMYSLCDVKGPSRWVSSWHGNGFLLIAEDKDSVIHWMHNRYGKENTSKIDPQPVPFVWLPRALRPEEYPNNAGVLLDVLDNMEVDHEIVIQLLVNEKLKHKSLLLGFNGIFGASLAGLRIDIPKTIKNGFRGLPPADVYRSRLNAAGVSGAHVTRLDSAWIHGRGYNLHEANLALKSAIIVGVGSLGSTVADILAKSGIGKIILVDYEPLGPENISRHLLGSTALGENKAIALARELQRQYPHLEFVGHNKTLEEFADANLDKLIESDVIISTTGSWRAESWLNALALKSESFPPVLYGWTEDYAAAGHATVFFHRDGCFRCLSNDKGRTKVPITVWDAETLLQVPACGAQFQPYGAVELSSIHSLIAELALDILLGKVTNSTHSVWIGQRKYLDGEVKGRWNPEWVALHGDPGQGGMFLTVKFEPNPICPQCGNK